MKIAGKVLPLVLAVAAAFAWTPSKAAGPTPCVHRLLVLSAFPGEIDHLLAATNVTHFETVHGRDFFEGTLRGNPVALAMTGIGIENADHTTRIALAHFRCDGVLAIDGIVFSGVAGGRSFIGDVTIPRRWTIDDGKSWFGVDPTMLSIAQQAAASVHLTDSVPLGDLACVGLDPDLIETIHMPQQPTIITGGDGKTADPFGGREFPCIPGGGDVFGCRPCRAPGLPRTHAIRFARDAVPFVDPSFFTGYFKNPTPSSTTYDAEDMETASVARVAGQFGLPFIAFRAMSDGKGDPLKLPGFPFQFFIYRQLAADNAATTALAFLAAWAAR